MEVSLLLWRGREMFRSNSVTVLTNEKTRVEKFNDTSVKGRLCNYTEMNTLYSKVIFLE